MCLKPKVSHLSYGLFVKLFLSPPLQKMQTKMRSSGGILYLLYDLGNGELFGVNIRNKFLMFDIIKRDKVTSITI